MLSRRRRQAHNSQTRLHPETVAQSEAKDARLGGFRHLVSALPGSTIQCVANLQNVWLAVGVVDLATLAWHKSVEKYFIPRTKHFLAVEV